MKADRLPNPPIFEIARLPLPPLIRDYIKETSKDTFTPSEGYYVLPESYPYPLSIVEIAVREASVLTVQHRAHDDLDQTIALSSSLSRLFRITHAAEHLAVAQRYINGARPPQGCTAGYTFFFRSLPIRERIGFTLHRDLGSETEIDKSVKYASDKIARMLQEV